MIDYSLRRFCLQDASTNYIFLTCMMGCHMLALEFCPVMWDCLFEPFLSMPDMTSPICIKNNII